MDLEELLRRRQDELRGRPEDWIDRLMHRLRYTDWLDVAFNSFAFIALGLLIAIEARVFFWAS